MDMSFETEHISRFQPETTTFQGQISILSDHLRTQSPQKPPTLPRIATLPIIQRLRTLAMSLRGQMDYGRGPSTRIPQPYPTARFTWPVTQDIARIPSVIQSPITTGPERTISPLSNQISIAV